jgi:predicted CXXCH cytochrome family protein
MNFHRFCRALVAISLVTVLAGCSENSDSGDATGESAAATAHGYVGANACGDCHAEQLEQWSGSHHELAMQPAEAKYVRGDFDDAGFAHNGIESKFFTRKGEYFIRTDGEDGELAEFPVRYTFGVYPLQQYIVELDNGRLQALGAAWDSRDAAEGGQRWFHVYGDEFIDSNDVLHWTKMSQNWDSMCAECHSTGLQKSFDVSSGQFDTHWTEINVACEACHGPGQSHVEWANSGDMTGDNGLTVQLDERDEISWLLDKATGNSHRSERRTTNVEITTCAPCHSRRSRIANVAEPVAEFLDAYRPALPQPPLYHADGQIRDEVYVYGSFLQSRMFQSGVTCSDCHEPHSLELRAPGSRVCLQCHAGDKFATASHQLQPEGGTEPACVDCHMPATTYMQVDARRDHSFRVPRPDLSVMHGTPNACTSCHSDRDPQWAADQLRALDRQPAGAGHWVDALVAVHATPWDAQRELLGLATNALAPGIVRATAISNLSMGGDAATTALISERATSTDPLIRWAVANSLQNSHPAVIVALGPQLLEDPVLAVRLEAVTAMAALDLELLPQESVARLQRGIEEYIAAQLVSAERPEAHVNIGNVNRGLRRLEEAEQSYRTALSLNQQFVPAYVNLADLYRAWGRDDEGQLLLREALERVPESGRSPLHHALGLTLVRAGRLPDAIDELELAAQADNAQPQFVLAYALGLDARGDAKAAADVLENSLRRFGDYPQLVAALVNVYQRMGDEPAARALAERMRNRN